MDKLQGTLSIRLLQLSETVCLRTFAAPRLKVNVKQQYALITFSGLSPTYHVTSSAHTTQLAIVDFNENIKYK